MRGMSVVFSGVGESHSRTFHLCQTFDGHAGKHEASGKKGLKDQLEKAPRIPLRLHATINSFSNPPSKVSPSDRMHIEAWIDALPA